MLIKLFNKYITAFMEMCYKDSPRCYFNSVGMLFAIILELVEKIYLKKSYLKKVCYGSN